MRRTIVYVDGYHLYYRLRFSKVAGARWLDLRRLARRFCPPPTYGIEAIKFFTAATQKEAPSKQRQDTYLVATRNAGVEVFMAYHRLSQIKCRATQGCGKTFPSYEEKETDVAIGVHLVHDAHLNRYDVALLVTNDSDQAPATRLVKQHFAEKAVHLAAPVNGVHAAKRLRSVVDKARTISESDIEHSRFVAASGMPRHWA